MGPAALRCHLITPRNIFGAGQTDPCRRLARTPGQPVYAQLLNLIEPDWKSFKAGAVNEFWQGLEEWQERWP